MPAMPAGEEIPGGHWRAIEHLADFGREDMVDPIDEGPAAGQSTEGQGESAGSLVYAAARIPRSSRAVSIVVATRQAIIARYCKGQPSSANFAPPKTTGYWTQMQSDTPQHATPEPKPDAEQQPAAPAATAASTASLAVVPMATKPAGKAAPKEKARAASEARLVATRLGNLNLITQAYGASAKLVDLLKVGATTISLLRAGKKAFTREFAASLERKLKLDDDWFDSPRSAADVPAAVWRKLGNPAATGASGDGPPMGVASKARKAAGVKRAGKKAAKKAGRKSAKRASKVAIAADAPMAARRNARKKSAAKVAGRKPGRPRAQATEGLAAMAAPIASARVRGSASSAMAELLVNTIVQKSQEGTLLDAIAYRMLGELMELTPPR